jgi:hypothetical protein
MNKIIKLSAIAFVFLIIFFLFNTLGNNTVKKESNVINVSVRDYLLGNLTAEIASVQNDLPLQIDNDTILVAINYKDDRVTSIYKLPKYDSRQDVNSKFIKNLAPMLLTQACSDEDKIKLMDFGVQFLIGYQDLTGSTVFETLINKQNCANKANSIQQ